MRAEFETWCEDWKDDWAIEGTVRDLKSQGYKVGVHKVRHHYSPISSRQYKFIICWWKPSKKPAGYAPGNIPVNIG